MHPLIRVTLLLTFACAGATLGFAQTPAPDAPSGTNVMQEAAQPAPPVAVEADKSIIYFYRVKQFAGSSLEPSVYCDDKELARMDNGRYFGVKLPPGKHTFRMGDKQTGFEIDMKAGQNYYAKVSLEIGMWKGHGRLTLIQPEQGSFEIKKVKPLGADKIKDRALVAIYEGSDKNTGAAKN